MNLKENSFIGRILVFMKHEIVLIYQMGKVGSTSIEKSLLNTSYHVEHVHSFYSPLEYEMFKNFKATKLFRPLSNRIMSKITSMVKKSIIRTKKDIRIISLVREPISRNISYFFQDIHIPISETRFMYDLRLENKNVLEELFYDKFNHKYGVNWFDNELYRMFGVDIYAYDFNKEKGCSVIVKGNLSILVIKMEKLNNLEEEIKGFLKLDKFELINDNRSNEKWYSELYKDFKDNFVPSDEYIDMLYNTKYMNHFYSEAEIEKFKTKWLNKRECNSFIGKSKTID